MRPMVRAALLIPLLLVGCDVTKFTANSTSGLFRRAAPAIERHWDYELVGEAMPSNIVQMEGLLQIVPENETIVTNAIRLYTGYAYGWIEDRVEVLQGEGHFLEAEAEMTRARYMYERARDLAVHLIGIDHEGFQAKYDEGLEPFQAWLQEEFDDAEDDCPGLLFAGYAWGSYINANKSDMEAVADLPFAEALVQRSIELDPAYFNHAGLIFMAVAKTAAPGADLDAAEPYWQRAIEATERRNLLLLVNMAKAYSVRRQDREQFVALLREVLEAGDVLPEQRLQNQIARRRAARYLRQVNELFPPDVPPAAPVPTPEPAPAPAPEPTADAAADAPSE